MTGVNLSPRAEGGILPGGQSPAEILASAQIGRFVIQDFCPLAQSIEWELGQRYLHERGNKVFLSDVVPVPFAINNNGAMSLRAAQVFFTSRVEAEGAGGLEPRIFVLELGIGLGLFARYFLDAFHRLCVQSGKDYYDRLCYVAADRSERMLLDLGRHGVLADHPGRYLLRVVDALHPERALLKEVAFAPVAGKPFRAVFLNYLLDCLPAAVVAVAGDEVQQLCVRTCLARGVKLSDYTPFTAEDLARKAASSDPRDHRDLLPLFGLFTSEYDYQPVDVARLAYGAAAVHFARSHAGSGLHSYGAIQSLERLLGLFHERGFILINDYGSPGATNVEEFEPQRYTGSTFVAVNFALLKSYFADTGPYHWVEPAEDNGHIYSRLLGHHIGPETAACFAEQFSKAAFDATEEPLRAARNFIHQGRYEAAATAFRKALEREPYNWMLLREVAAFLTFTLHHPAAGLAMAEAALRLNPACSADLWNTLGDSLFALGRVEAARQAYRRALRVNPGDVGARYNLSWVLLHDKDYAAGLHMIAEALALDKLGEYRERLLQKQAEILGHLAQRNQLEFQLLANRSRKYPFPAVREAGGGDAGKRPTPTTP
jgi:tetratricopeptide (TPR) repeat protein